MVFKATVFGLLATSATAPLKPHPKIIEVEIRHRQTDRQTNSLTPYTGGCGFFLQVKFATSLLASLAGDNDEDDEK